jgi:hypothetical protein
MTKKILLFTAFAGITALTMSSYNDGPWGPNGTNGLNRTGSAGSSANCTGSGCHGANNTNTKPTIVVSANGNPVTKYIPGVVYTVTVGGGNTSAALPKFGFQLSAVKTANTSQQAGSFSSAPANVAIRTAGSLQLVEHSSPLSGTGSGNNWLYATSFNWTAPATGTGQVTFYLTLNAVNGNNATSGDQPNSVTATLNEVPAGINEVQGAINVSAYPNPATDYVRIKMSDVANGRYTLAVFDLNGKKVATSDLEVSSNNFETALDARAWAAGLYHIKIAKDGAEKTLSVVKQ